MDSSITRRSLIGAACAAAAGASLACAASHVQAAEPTGGAADYEGRVTQTLTCDIAVVGGGMAGLACAVEALNRGASVIVCESMAQPGGNGNVTSVMFGVGSDMQKAQGIDLTPADIIKLEMDIFRYDVSGTLWADLIANSAENIAWVKEQGCLMRDVVDNYPPNGLVDTAHWWDSNGATGYVAPMVARLEELGGQLLLETPARELIVDGDAVVGVYAESPEGIVRIDAGAVVIATGGFADNPEMLAENGMDTRRYSALDTPGHNGDGIQMALRAGARSWLNNYLNMEFAINPEIGDESETISYQPGCVWVNEKGRRYADEGCALKSSSMATLASRPQADTFVLFDQAIYDSTAADEAASWIIEVIDGGVESGAICKADSIDELAAAAGIDPAALAETVAEYNGFCADGVDKIYGKDPSLLLEIGTAPFYLSRNSGVCSLTTIGGIDTTENCEAYKVGAGHDDVVPGLYAAGIDGCKLYKTLYTIDIPATCVANNINSGRKAAKNALAYLGK